MQNPEKLLKPRQMGIHVRILSESYPMNTNTTRFRWFSKIFRRCALDESSLSIGLRVKIKVVGPCVHSRCDWKDKNNVQSIGTCAMCQVQVTDCSIDSAGC